MMIFLILIIGTAMRTPTSMLIWILMLWVFNISLAVLVKHNAESRNLDNGVLWGVFCFFFGLPIALLFFLMNIKFGTKTDDKKAKTHQRNALIACAVAVIISVAITPYYIYEGKQADLRFEYESSYREAYLNADGTHYVCYDKMGNEYLVNNLDGSPDELPYFTREGVRLEFEDYSYEVEEYDYTKDYYRYASADGKIIIDDSRALIDEDGYIVDIDKNNLEDTAVEVYSNVDWEEDVYVIYSDKKGNFYFEPQDCSWDKDGNLVFKSQEINDFYNEHK